MGKNALAFVAGLGGGYLQAQQKQQELDRQEKLDKIQTDRAAREQTTFDQQQADSRTLRDAAAPVSVEQPNDVLMDDDGNPMPAVPAFRVAGQRYDSLDQAQTAAKTYNSPESLRTRQAAAFDQIGRPDQAMSLQSAQTAQKLHTLQLSEAEQAAIKQKFLRDAGAAISQGGHVGAADFLTKSKADGNDYKAEKDENGNIAYYQVNRETGQARHVATFDDSEKGRMDAFSMMAASVSPEHMVAHYKDERDFNLKQQQADDKANYQANLIDSKREALKTQVELNLARAEAARAKAGQTTPTAPIWDQKADDFLKSKYAFKDEITGRPVVDGEGMAFAKMIALAEARRNGGDTTVALGKAMDIDAKIAADAGGDKNKIREGRKALLNALFNPSVAKPAPIVPQTSSGKAAALAEAAGKDGAGTITFTPGVGKGYVMGSQKPTLANAKALPNAPIDGDPQDEYVIRKVGPTRSKPKVSYTYNGGSTYPTKEEALAAYRAQKQAWIQSRK